MLSCQSMRCASSMALPVPTSLLLLLLTLFQGGTDAAHVSTDADDARGGTDAAHVSTDADDARGYAGITRTEISQAVKRWSSSGSWTCPARLGCCGQCAMGYVYCKCPGDNSDPYYWIDCTWDSTAITWWCGEPSSGRNHWECSRYEKCATCRTDIYHYDDHPCETCLTGWTGKDCQTDINECMTANGNCDHTCVNSPGSYKCECDEGYYLRTDTNCTRVDCSEEDLPGITVSYSDGVKGSSWAEYECEVPGQVLDGPSQRQCKARGQTGYWEGNTPTCIEGSRPTRPYMRVSGKTPDRSAVIEEHRGYNPASCQSLCEKKPDTCQAYADKPEVLDGGVVLNYCQLLNKDYAQLKSEKKLTVAAKASVFTPVILPTEESALKKTYRDLRLGMIDAPLGCYGADELDEWDSYDLPDLVKSNADSDSDWEDNLERNLKVECNNLCHRFGTRNFGIKDSLPNCYCGKFVPLFSYDKYSCGANVTAYKTQDRFNGKCYADQMTGDSRDLRNKVWGAEEKKSKQECINHCRDLDYPFAGIQNGGDCYCDDRYGMYTDDTMDHTCNVSCQAADDDGTCGGQDLNQVYTTYPAQDLIDDPFIQLATTKVFDDSGKVTGVTTDIFSKLPGLRIFTTKKLVLYSSEEVKAARGGEDQTYSTCGEIQNLKSHERDGEKTVTLRFFFLRLSDLAKYAGLQTTSLHVYAQTLLIDADADFTFSLLIRATQILVDPNRPYTITVSGEAPDLEMDLEKVKFDGPEPNKQFMRESFMCVRMLRETRQEDNILTGWLIMYELTNSKTSQQQHKSIQTLARSYRSKFLGVDKTDTHIMSDYTTEHLSKLLGNYAERIAIYKQELDKMEIIETTASDLIKYADNMNSIYVETSVAEAKSNYEDALVEYQYSQAIYQKKYIKYNTSRDFSNAKAADFRNFVKAQIAQNIFNAVFSFIAGIADAVVGIIKDKDPGRAINGIKDAIDGIQSIDVSLWKLEDLVDSIQKFMASAEKNFQAMEDQTTPYDDEKYAHQVEMVATLSTQIIEWDHLKDDADSIMEADPVFGEFGGKDYGNSIKDLSNWGIALSESMIEKAEKTREAMALRTTWDMRLDMQEKAKNAIANMNQDNNKRVGVMETMREQAYDVAADLNDVLIKFCQAYFFDTLNECGPAFAPRFGGDLTEMLLRINTARKEALLAMPAGLVSSTTVDVLVTDTDTDPECEDVKLCPVNYLKKKGEFHYKIGTDHRNLIGLDQYRVAEIILDFEGAKANGSRSYLSVILDGSGQFQGSAFDKVYNFLGESITLEYEYDINLGIRDSYGIRKNANIYERYENMVAHITPYTTWFITINQRRPSDVDLSEVTGVRMYFKGSTTTAGSKKRHEFYRMLIDTGYMTTHQVRQLHTRSFKSL